MLTIISYPKSGALILSEVMKTVFGLEVVEHLSTSSITLNHKEKGNTPDLTYKLPNGSLNHHVIYLIRDGRDCLISTRAITDATGVSMAESVDSQWSVHVDQKIRAADHVVHFEAFLHDPLSVILRLSGLMGITEVALDESVIQSLIKDNEIQDYSIWQKECSNNQQGVRYLTPNLWKQVLTKDQALRFWHLNGETAERFGYDLDGYITIKGYTVFEAKRHILIEASKLTDSHADGIYRFVTELLFAIENCHFQNLIVDVLVDDQLYALDEAIHRIKSKEFISVAKRRSAMKRFFRGLMTDKGYEHLAQVKHHLTRSARNLINGKARLLNKNYDAVLLTLPQNFAFLEHVSTRRVVGVIHDLTHQSQTESHQAQNVTLAELGIKWLLERNSDFIAVSKATQEALLNRHIESHMIHEGVNRRKFYSITNDQILRQIRERYELPSTPFVLSVGTLEPRKNVARLIEAFTSLPESERAEVQLIIAGKKGWKWQSDLDPEDGSSHVRFIGYVDDVDLPGLYTLAGMFAYISIEEGFGLPVLEAMACGCQVLISDSSSLPEIGGQVAHYCQPTDIASIQDGLLELMRSIENKQLTEMTIKRTWDFTWSETALKTMNVLTSEREMQL